MSYDKNVDEAIESYNPIKDAFRKYVGGVFIAGAIMATVYSCGCMAVDCAEDSGYDVKGAVSDTIDDVVGWF